VVSLLFGGDRTPVTVLHHPCALLCVNQPSKDGKTPIESAKEEGHEGVVQMLLPAIAVSRTLSGCLEMSA
jgi:hypothetical protein